MLLADKIRSLDLAPDEKALLLQLLNTQKKYGLVWEQKAEAVEEQLAAELPVLQEVTDRAIVNGAEHPNHVLIEGDNLHALTSLSFTHAGKVDVIYIDPPYNTGNKDFKYNDHYVDREDSYRHSKWLSFMHKRLRLARTLLKDTGVIFISIDDNEQAQLKLLCDEVFGEEAYVGLFPWRKRTTKSDVTYGVSQDFEYVLCVAKPSFHGGITHERKYLFTDDFKDDGWRLSDLTKQTTAEERPNSAFDLVNPRDGKVYRYNPMRVWSITQDTFSEYYKSGKIVFPGDYEFLKIKIPAWRVFESEDKQKAAKRFGSDVAIKSASTFLPKEVGMNEDGNSEVLEILGSKRFSFPKPIGLIYHLLGISRSTSATILDFFAGSGTTLHATMQLNAQDGGKRQCILVTNNENNIAEEVCYERNRRVIQGYTNAKGQSVEGLAANNLRYYKTAFVPAARSEANRRLLARSSTALLCLRENCFLPLAGNLGFAPEEAAFFTDGLGKTMLIVYHSRQQWQVVERLAEAIQGFTPRRHAATSGASSPRGTRGAGEAQSAVVREPHHDALGARHPEPVEGPAATSSPRGTRGAGEAQSAVVRAPHHDALGASALGARHPELVEGPAATPSPRGTRGAGDITFPITVYGFSPGRESLAEDFAAVAEAVHCIALPEAILQAYQSSFRAMGRKG